LADIEPLNERCKQENAGGITVDFPVIELTDMDVLRYCRDLGTFNGQPEFEAATSGKSGIPLFSQNPLNSAN
jgi:hypothetical protein